MIQTSTKVEFRKTDVYRGKRKTTHWVRWTVDGKEYKEPRGSSGLAEAFRSQLVVAASQGEAFVLETGLPISMHRAALDVPWYAFSRGYADQKWDGLSGNSRRNTAYSLSIATLAMCRQVRGKPSDQLLNKALAGWAFNKLQRGRRPPPADVADALKWLENNTLPITTLTDPDEMRSMLDRLTKNADGSKAAADTVARRRGVVYNALKGGVPRIFETHPMDGLDWSGPEVDDEVDWRVVANPFQARTLLLAVGEEGRKGPRVVQSGPRLVAFFASMYYAALRPEEAVNLRERNLVLPSKGWGELILEGSAPLVGQAWADIAGQREERPLKHRSPKATRRIPCHPELVKLFRWHIDNFGTTPDGRLFRATNEGEMPVNTYNRIWKRARLATFTREVAASPLAGRPYDLRHACVSLWLNSGVDPTDVAAWAGHSLGVLLRIYAKCVDGRLTVNLRRIEAGLRGE